MPLPGSFTKVSGDIFGVADYNDIQSRINTTLGTGSSDAGYGQLGGSYGTFQSGSSQTATNIILASDIAKFKTDLDNLSLHQQGSSTFYRTLPTISATNTFLAADLNSYYNTSVDCYNNRLTAHSSALSFTAGVAPSFNNWNGTRTHEVSVAFGSANAGRYFFNSGGYIAIQPSIAYASFDATKDGKWKTLFETDTGIVQFRARSTARTGSGGTLSSTIGYWQNVTWGSATWTTLFFAASTTPYAANDYTVNVKVSSDGATVYFQMIFDDGSVGNPVVDENVGNTTSSVSSYRSNAYSIVVPAPTITTTSGP